ncbi:50S ribosomal protein L32 [Bienertia sinuspersici]
MEDIRDDPDIKGKELNEKLFKKFGLYMKQSTLYKMKAYGVDLALKDVWPTAKRRYCCRHLSRNFKKVFPGPLMYILFWRACNATNPFTFKKAMERLRIEGKAPVMKWFAEIGNQAKWTKHKFETSVCCDSNTSNFVESFNSTLGTDRCRPILTLLEGIRRDDEGICPKVAQIVKDIGKTTRFCQAHMSAPGEFEVHEGNSQFPLSLNKMKCGCGAWQLSGIPCRHAMRAMIATKLDPHSYVSPWYSVKYYKATYDHNIAAMPDHAQWPDFEGLPKVLPPAMKRGVGRPCRNRRREEGEDAKGKRANTVKCANCGHFGHNMRTCKGGPTAKDLQSIDQLMVTLNKRKRGQNNINKSANKKAKQQPEVIINSGSQPSSSQPIILSQAEAALI